MHTVWQSKARAPTEAGSTGSGRCAYTVELVKPGDPEGTGRGGGGGGGGGEPELQGAAGALAVDKSAGIFEYPRADLGRHLSSL